MLIHQHFVESIFATGSYLASFGELVFIFYAEKLIVNVTKISSTNKVRSKCFDMWVIRKFIKLFLLKVTKVKYFNL